MRKLPASALTFFSLALLSAGALAADVPVSTSPEGSSPKPPGARGITPSTEKPGATEAKPGSPVVGTAPGGHGGGAGATGAAVGSGNTGTSADHTSGASGSTGAGADPGAKGVTGGAK